MANKKIEIDAKAKAAPAATPSEAGQKTKTFESKVPVATPEPIAVEKNEKKAQAAKKGGKGQQTIVKEPMTDQAKVATEKTTAPSGAKIDDGEAKAKKVKEKGKKQIAVELEVPPVIAETALVHKTGALEQSSEKATKMKRLTLDIAKPLHKAIKAKAVEEGVPMVDMLRSLLEKHYSK